jgi:hypothetical protein
MISCKLSEGIPAIERAIWMNRILVLLRNKEWTNTLLYNEIVSSCHMTGIKGLSKTSVVRYVRELEMSRDIVVEWRPGNSKSVRGNNKPVKYFRKVNVS